MFTDYRPRCDRNLEYAAPMAGSWDYRQYLIGNGEKIIDANRAAAAQVALCAPCVQPFDQGTMAPDADRVVCDKVSCTRVKPVNPSPYGIGTGRDYGMTQQARTADAAFVAQRSSDGDGAKNCCGCASAATGAFGATYPGAMMASPGPTRWAVPGGGAAMA
jgi:hypothetical protein